MEKKATDGDQAAQLELGVRYVEGKGVTTNLLKAFKWLSLAADQGLPDAERRVGEMLVDGLGTKPNVETGIRWLVKAAGHSNVQSEVALASIYFRGVVVSTNYPEAIKWCSRAAEHGNAEAQGILGSMYALGQGVPVDNERARVWFEKAATNNDPQGMFNLGTLYFKGAGTPTNYALAFKWWLRAAEAGSIESQKNIAEMYRTGFGIEQNTLESVKWCQKAAQGGNAEAQYSLGKFYAAGTGVPRDAQRALTLLESSARGGFPEAQNDFGYLLRSGDGMPLDLRRGLIWLTCAASQAHPRAMTTLGTSYMEGIGVPKDPPEGLKWFYLAEKQGSFEGKVNRRTAEALLDLPEVVEAKRRADAFSPIIGRTVTTDDTEPTTVRLYELFRIPVNVFGKTNYFVVDTGSDITLIDSRQKMKLGEPMNVRPALAISPQAYDVSLFAGQEILIGSRRFKPEWVAQEDFARFRTNTGMAFDGVFGMDCLADHVVTFDGTEGTFSIGGAVSEASQRTGLALPLEKESRRVQINATFPGTVSLRLMIDSGNNGFASLCAADWKKVFPVDPTNTWTNLVWGVAGQSVASKHVRLPSLKIGTNVYTNFVVQRSESGNSTLGQEFLRQHIATFDFPNSMLYLLPSLHFGEPEIVNETGLTFIRKGKALLVGSISKESPAYRAGIRSHDQICAIGDQNVDDFEQRKVLQLLQSNPGKGLNLKIKHAGKIRQIAYIHNSDLRK